MIRIKIKLKNDHRTMTEDFEASVLDLNPANPVILEWVEKMMKEFKDPVDDVILKATMEL